MSLLLKNENTNDSNEKKEDTNNSHELSMKKIRELGFNLDFIMGELKDDGIHRVALQLSPDLFKHGFLLHSTIQQKIPSLRCFICADSTYGACCCDLITAEKYQADALVHLGNQACLQEISFAKSGLKKVIHVFQEKLMDVKKCAESIREHRKGELIVLFDLDYENCMDDLRKELKSEIDNGEIFIGDVSSRKIQSKKGSNQVGHFINGFYFPKNTDHCQFCYIGKHSSHLTQLIMEKSQNAVSWLRFDPQKNIMDSMDTELSSSYRELRKRFALFSKAKQADVFGIVVATVTVSKYLEVIKYTQDLIQSAGKKCYTFYVGKINVPKLANFEEIDIFCVISCNQCSLIDSKEFYKPIISPFELACSIKDEWDGSFSTEFETIMNKVSIETSNQEKGECSESSKKEENQSHALSIRSENQLSIIEQSPAIAYLQERGYKGLDFHQEKEVQNEIKIGQKGIAMGYEGR